MGLTLLRRVAWQLHMAGKGGQQQATRTRLNWGACMHCLWAGVLVLWQVLLLALVLLVLLVLPVLLQVVLLL